MAAMGVALGVASVAHPPLVARPASYLVTRPQVVRPTVALPATRASGKKNFVAHARAYDRLESLQCNISAFPDVKFFKIESIIRPWRLEKVTADLSKRGVKGMTVTTAMGAGVQQGRKERYGGSEFGSSDHFLVDKVKLEVVVKRDQVNSVVQLISGSTYTGEIGDGKIFVSPVADVIRIRTGETGEMAEHMSGGLEDAHQLVEAVV